MNINLCVALRDAEEFIYCVPLVLRKYDWRLGQCLEIDALHQGKAALGIDRQCLRESGTGRAELMVVLFKHFAQT